MSAGFVERRVPPRRDATPAALRALLRDRYGAPVGPGLALRRLSREAGKGIFRVSAGANGGDHAPGAAGAGMPWVARVYPPRQRPEALRAQAAVLHLLEQRGYPAPRVVPALDGSLITVLSATPPDGPPAALAGHDHPATPDDPDDPDRPDGKDDAGSRPRPVLVTTYVAGRSTGLSLPGLRAHGAAVGRLHALAVPCDPDAAGLRPASMLPRNELAAATSWLEAVRERVPPGLRPRYGELEAACQALQRFEAGPRVLLHNDCHPWNSVRAPDGRVVLVDWEGAGLGPAAVDLGFVALSADTGGLVGPVVPPDPARLDALLDGYAAYHRPPAAELERLTDAVRFRTLVAACADFARAVARQTEPVPWGWQRYLAAGAIAGRIRARLGG
jgi:Ser/Thr protein kinase RdoA (MazF antagonist)